MNGVVNSDELRAAYNACLPLLTAWHTELAQNERLYRAYETILANEGDRLSAGQRKLLQNALRDFRLAGVALPAEQKSEFKALVEQLATLQSKFDENVLDATNAWSRHVTQESEIAGLPQPIVERARAAAQTRQLEGWFFTLDAPNYQAVMMHAENEALRREFYQGWVTRASDQGATDGRWDNTQLMAQILELRHEVAQLVGYPNYAEYSLATKMASSVDEVRAFLEQLARQSRPVAAREYDELTQLRRPQAERMGRRVLRRAAASASAATCRKKSCARISRCRACSRACSRSPKNSTACASPSAAASTSIIRTRASTTFSTPTARGAAASSSICTRARRSAAARGWTSASAASSSATRLRCRSRIWCATSCRRSARSPRC